MDYSTIFERKYSVIYRIFFFLFFIHAITFAHSQPLNPCGTPAYKSPWLKAYQQRPPIAQIRSNQDSMLFIPMTIHSVGEDDGDGHLGTIKILEAFCQLNADFQESNIQFYLVEDIRLINNSAIYEHDSIYLAGLFMLENDLPGTLNTYIVRNPAGNCGYNLPWASMTVAQVCTGETSHTWAHEVGHHFTIQHPFLGWERGISYDGSIEPDFSQPAPDFVLYDYTIFKDQPFVDTLIIDTAFVERIDGSNCHIAADGFCDTAPDYLSRRWECSNNGESNMLQTDPNGSTFRSDASLIMSNAEDGCARRFSPQQIAAMRAYVIEKRQDLFANPLPIQAAITTTPTLLYPLADAAVPIDAVELSWEAVPNATRYFIQVSRLSSFPEGLTFTYETDQSTIVINDLVSDRDYFWQVRPYNAFYTCTEFSAVESFEVVESVTSIAAIEGLTSLDILPTLQQVGQPIRVQLETDKALTGTLEIFNAVGQPLFEQSFVNANGLVTFSIPTSELADGIYLVGIRTNTGFVFKRVVLI